MNVLQFIAVAAVRIAVGIVIVVVVVIVRPAKSREERREMPEVAVMVAMAEMPGATPLDSRKPGAGRHRQAPGAETTGSETIHTGEPAAVKATATKTATVKSSAAETAAMKSTTAESTTETTVTSAAKAATAMTAPTAAACQRERRRKRADRCNGSQRDDKFFEHRSTPQNDSLHWRYNSGNGFYIRRVPSHSRNELSVL